MDISGSHRFNAAPQQVWAALHDSALLQGCVPGAQQITWQGDQAINVVAGIALGPVHQSAGLTVQVTQQEPPRYIRLEGKTPNVAAWATVDLSPDGTGTLLSYNAHADLSGPLSAVATLAKPFAESQLKNVFACLDQKIR